MRPGVAAWVRLGVVAAGVRRGWPLGCGQPEQLTQSNTPPPRPATCTTPPRTTRQTGEGRPRRRPTLAGGPGGAGSEPVGSEVTQLLGSVDLEALAERRRRLRQDLGLPARLWIAGHLAQVLVAAVRDHDRPSDAAVPALLAVAADPATRSPARLACPGPWWTW